MELKLRMPKRQTVLSALGAAVSMVLTNPFNLIRFRMQTMPDLLIQKQIEVPYKGPADCFKRVYCQQGFKAFWKGNGSNILRFYPAEALTFVLKDIFNRKLSSGLSRGNYQAIHINTLSGILSGCITLTILYPLQYARLKLINHVKGKKLGITNIIWSTLKAQGIQGIFRGSLMSYLGMIAFRGIYFGLYDSYKNTAQNFMQKMVISYLSTVGALIGIYPFDTIRRRIMMTSGQQYKYGPYSKFIKCIYKGQGLKGFFPGLPVIFFQALTIGTMFILFDQLFCVQDIKS